MPSLGEFRTRPARPARPTGYANAPAEEELATYKQLDLIDRLRAERGYDPLPRSTASAMTKKQAGVEIDNLFATPKYTGPPPSPDDCPQDWDADIWHLTLRFQQYARADGIELRPGRHMIYAEIEALVSRYTMRGRMYPQEVYGCERRHLGADMAARCWYHWPPDKPAEQVAGEIDWVQKVEIIMAEFWSRIWDDNAADGFRQHFAEYGRDAVRHWRSLRMVKAIDERPKQPRQIMRRAKMAADSEEG
jgi:hypothetical protein